MYFAAWLYQLRGDRQAVHEQETALIPLAAEQGFTFFLALGTILRGWGLAERGRGEEAIAQMRQGLAAWRATGSELHRPYFLGMLAEAYGREGQIEAGLNVLTEALAVLQKTADHQYEAELYRLKGTLALRATGQGPGCW